jgi:hypothetical protein
MVLLLLSNAEATAPTCEAIAEARTLLQAFQESATALDGELWPGWETDAIATGAILGDTRPWVAWFSAPTASRQLSCGQDAGAGRARWAYRSLGGLSAVAQLDSRRRPDLAILVDLNLEDWTPRDWLAIYAHELFHVHQLSVMDKSRFSDTELLGLHRAWPRGRAQLEPALHTELAAGWAALADRGDLRPYLQARRARQAALAELDPSLTEASLLMEEFEGVARYIEVSVETHPEATRAFGGPRDPEEALQSGALSILDGKWWYPTGFLAARLLDQRVADWKGRLYTEGLEALLQEAAHDL